MVKGGEHSANVVTMTVGALLGGAVSLAVTLLLLLACSAAISAGILSEQLELHITIAACVVGGFCGGCLTRRRWGHHALPAGLAAGSVFFLLLLCVSLIFLEDTDFSRAGLGVLAGCLCGGGLGWAVYRKKKEEKEEKLLKSLFPYAIMQTRIMEWREYPMTHIKTLNGATLKQSASYGGCGECQTSCQSACKTSCTVANQKCEHKK